LKIGSLSGGHLGRFLSFGAHSYTELESTKSKTPLREPSNFYIGSPGRRLKDMLKKGLQHSWSLDGSMRISYHDRR
jgi:hypothetical protein